MITMKQDSMPPIVNGVWVRGDLVAWIVGVGDMVDFYDDKTPTQSDSALSSARKLLKKVESLG